MVKSVAKGEFDSSVGWDFFHIFFSMIYIFYHRYMDKMLHIWPSHDVSFDQSDKHLGLTPRQFTAFGDPVIHHSSTPK